MVLRALEMPAGLLFLSGQWHGWKDPDTGASIGFSFLPFVARERIIGALLTSPIAPTRGVCAGRPLRFDSISCFAPFHNPPNQHTRATTKQLTLLIKGMTGRIFFGSRGPPGADGAPTANPTWNALRYEDRNEQHVQRVLSGGGSGNGNGNGKGNGKKPAPLKEPKLKPLKKGDVPPSSVGGGTDVRELFCDVVIVGSGAGAYMGWEWRHERTLIIMRHD